VYILSRMLQTLDWLIIAKRPASSISTILTSSEQYFNYIQDENMFINIKIDKEKLGRNWTTTGQATFFECHWKTMKSRVGMINLVYLSSLQCTNICNRIQYSQINCVINHCDRHMFCSIKYIFKISFTFRVLLTITQKAYQNK
jgi:hypothetical protein